jgi:triacylglycerol lipase
MASSVAAGDGARDALPPLLGGWRGALGLPLWAEGRAAAEAAALVRSPVWRGDGVPPGDGRPVVLVPGFLAGSGSMELLTRWLRRHDYAVTSAPVGRSAGPSSQLAADVERAVTEAASASGRPAVLIGHSRGGQASRVATVRRPDAVDALVTLGAPVRTVLPSFLPVRAPIEAIRLASVAGLVRRPDPVDERRYALDLVGPFPADVPWTAVWSRSDGVVDWRACLDRAASTCEVTGSHVGLVANAQVYRAVAEVFSTLA